MFIGRVVRLCMNGASRFPGRRVFGIPYSAWRGIPDAKMFRMNAPLSETTPPHPVIPADQSEEPVQNAAEAVVAQAATGAAYGGALGAPGGPAALVVGAVAGALAAVRPGTLDEDQISSSAD